MEQYPEIWERVLELFKERYTETVCNLWLSDAKLNYLDATRASIEVPSAFKRNILLSSHKEHLEGVISDTVGYPVTVSVTYPDMPKEAPAANDAPESEPQPLQEINEQGITPIPSIVSNADYTFGNFIVGNSNKFAHAACYAVAKSPATDYNPLFIYGASGLGKTHLLNAISNEIRRLHPEMVIKSVKGDDFTNQMIESIRNNSQTEFRNIYRQADVLLIDDIQFIAGKNATQEEFFHTFNALYEENKQIIMTSDRPPKDIKLLEDRLKTRFEWGLIADIQPPDLELRLAIVKNKAKTIGLKLTDEMCNVIAESVRSNIRQLEGVVKRISAKTFLSGETLSVKLVHECVDSIVHHVDDPQTIAEKIIKRVAKKYDISQEDLMSKNRTKTVSDARTLAIYIIRRVTGMSFPELGKLFNRDHSTIITANTKLSDRISENHLLELEVNEIIEELME